MTHSHHPMHAHSLAAYDSLDINDRERQVLCALDSLGGAGTDKEIARAMVALFPELGEYDPNLARPRITTLIGKNVLRQVGRDLSNPKKPQRIVEMVKP